MLYHVVTSCPVTPCDNMCAYVQCCHRHPHVFCKCAMFSLFCMLCLCTREVYYWFGCGVRFNEHAYHYQRNCGSKCERNVGMWVGCRAREGLYSARCMYFYVFVWCVAARWHASTWLLPLVSSRRVLLLGRLAPLVMAGGKCESVIGVRVCEFCMHDCALLCLSQIFVSHSALCPVQVHAGTCSSAGCHTICGVFVYAGVATISGEC